MGGHPFGPTGASRGGTQARCLKLQLSLTVSMISKMTGKAVEKRSRHIDVAEHGAIPQ